MAAVKSENGSSRLALVANTWCYFRHRLSTHTVQLESFILNGDAEKSLNNHIAWSRNIPEHSAVPKKG